VRCPAGGEFGALVPVAAEKEGVVAAENGLGEREGDGFVRADGGVKGAADGVPDEVGREELDSAVVYDGDGVCCLEGFDEGVDAVAEGGGGCVGWEAEGAILGAGVEAGLVEVVDGFFGVDYHLLAGL